MATTKTSRNPLWSRARSTYVLNSAMIDARWRTLEAKRKPGKSGPASCALWIQGLYSGGFTKKMCDGSKSKTLGGQE